MEKELLEQMDGFRCDSGDPIAWTRMIMAHYKKFGIDMSKKTIIIDTPFDFNPVTKMVEVNIAKVKSVLDLTEKENLKVEFI